MSSEGFTSPARIPDFVLRRPSGAYVGLNPTTKLVIALAEAAIAFVVRGWTGPLVVLAVVVGSSLAAGVARRLWPFALATIPLVASILLINTFLFPGVHEPIVRLGPVAPTWDGLAAGLQATFRVIAFALSVAVFSLTTTTDDLLTDLEHRGVGRRTVFVIGAAIGMVPRMRERASEIVDSQRSRGLDTEGARWRRFRGVLPLVGPMIFSALAEVEERTMALEARAFTAPARRTMLRRLPDRPGQRVVRWSLGALTVAALIGSVSGRLSLP